MSLLDIVVNHYPGKQDQLVYDLVTQLEHQVVRPNLFLSIPHYFFDKYGGSLRPNEAALIWYLRSLYKDDDSDSHKFSCYSQLGVSLGCGLKTVQRMIDSCAPDDDEPITSSWNFSFVENSALRNWLSVQFVSHNKNGAADKYSIGVRTTEPIHQDDNGLYVQLVEDLLSLSQSSETDADPQPGQNITPNEGNPIPQPGQNITPDEEEDKPLPGQTITPPVQNITPAGQDITSPGQTITPNLVKPLHLKSSYNDSLNASINDSLIPPLPSTADHSTQNGYKVVGVGEINLEKLLGFGSYKHNEKKNLVELIEKNQEDFLAWIMRNHITAAKFPVRLAVKNVQEGNETEDHYLEISKMGWEIAAEMVRVSEHDMDMWKEGIFDDDEGREYLAEIFRKISKLALKAIKDLKDTDFMQLVENVLMDAEE